jgi:nitrite reductase (NO-forming)
MLLHHMCMGMYGAVVVDPAGGWPGMVDREYVLVQSEFYTKPVDPKRPEIVTTDLEAANRKDATYVAFNGKAFRHQEAPLFAKAGERVRLFVLNAGPCDTSSFHVVGTIMDRVYLDGNPANLLKGMQTVLLGSSSGAVVEMKIPEVGKYPIVDHEFADATKGAIAVLDASGGKEMAEAPAQPLECKVKAN